MGETYYEILEVSPDASRDEIRSAYRERVLETHPDHNDAPEAAEAFQRVSRANEVLTDEAERARYDRLGHDAYVRFTDGSAMDRNSGTDPRAAADRVRSAANATTSETEAGSGTTNHQARQRRERRRRTARRRASEEWPFGPSGESTESDESRTTHGREATASGPAGTADDSGFRYAVHDWDGEVDLERKTRPITHTTAVTLGCLWVLYPALVASSLTSAFPLAVNAVVAACTIGVVAYLLTWPRIAVLIFGSWSLLIPAGMVALDVGPPLSVIGALALGFVWIPFGYAIALWWVLRP